MKRINKVRSVYSSPVALVFSVILLMIFMSCHGPAGEKQNKKYTFYVGTYTDGASEGIYQYTLHDDGKLEKMALAAPSNNPSYLAISHDNRYLLAVNEIDQSGQGQVESYRIHKDTLERLSAMNSGGAHPCFIQVDERGYVLTANYSGGNIALLRTGRDGRLTELIDVARHSGKGTTARQEAPHAHSAWFAPSSDKIVAADLGTNEIWFYTLDTVHHQLRPDHPERLAMEEGAGPRHLTFHPNDKWMYVINELNSTVTLVEISQKGQYQKVQSASTLPSDFNGSNKCADIHVSSDGRFVYASNRGHNSIAVFQVDEQDGSLRSLGYQSVRGQWPRNFALSPDEKYLLVANRHTNNIVCFERNTSTGRLKYVGESDVPEPVCIMFKRYPRVQPEKNNL